MPKPAEYKHIKAWGQLLGSYKYFIDEEQRKAAATGAPLDAIHQKEDGTWSTVNDIWSISTREQIDRMVQDLKDQDDQEGELTA